MPELPGDIIFARIPFCPKCKSVESNDWKPLWWGLSQRVKCPHCNYKWNPKEEQFFREYGEYHGINPGNY